MTSEWQDTQPIRVRVVRTDDPGLRAGDLGTLRAFYDRAGGGRVWDVDWDSGKAIALCSTFGDELAPVQLPVAEQTALAALMVVAHTDHIRSYLEHTDPKALEQVEAAIRGLGRDTAL